MRSLWLLNYIINILFTKNDFSCDTESDFVDLFNHLLEKFQWAQNNTHFTVFCRQKEDHATHLLWELHWLPVQTHADENIVMLCYLCLHGLAQHTSLNDSCLTIQAGLFSLIVLPFSLCHCVYVQSFQIQSQNPSFKQ